MNAMMSFGSAGDFTVATVSAEIDLANAPDLFDELRRGVRSEARGLIVDLSTVRYLDSAGVQSLFDVARELQISRQHLGLVLPETSPIRRLVKITRLDEVAALAPTVDACLFVLEQTARPAS